MNNRKKILIVCQRFWPESFRVNDVANFFVEKGYEVDVLCGIPNYPGGKFYKGYSLFKNRHQIKDGLQIRRVFEIPRGNGSTIMIALNNISFALGSLFHIPRLVFKDYEKIFMFEVSPVFMTISGIILGKIKKIQTTMWVIDIWPDNLVSFLNIKNRFLIKIIKKISIWHYKNTDKIIGMTQTMSEKLAEYTNRDIKQIPTLPLTCEKLFENKSIDSKLQKKFSNSFNIVFTGTLTPIISPETIVRAALAIQEKGYKNINWVIVGDGMSRQWLEKEVRKSKLSKYFYFEGQQPIGEVPKYTTIADVLLSTLRKDKLLEVTIPSKITSYMACGKPIVIAMDGEPANLINKTACGYAGPSEDWQSLANNIELVYKLSSKDRKKMGNNARGYYLKYLERNVVLNKLEKIILS